MHLWSSAWVNLFPHFYAFLLNTWACKTLWYTTKQVPWQHCYPNYIIGLKTFFKIYQKLYAMIEKNDREKDRYQEMIESIKKAQIFWWSKKWIISWRNDVSENSQCMNKQRLGEGPLGVCQVGLNWMNSLVV